MKYRTYTQMEAILRNAFDVEGNSIKDVAKMANINLNTLYKWNCGAMLFSLNNIDTLLMIHFLGVSCGVVEGSASLRENPINL